MQVFSSKRKIVLIKKKLWENSLSILPASLPPHFQAEKRRKEKCSVKGKIAKHHFLYQLRQELFPFILMNIGKFLGVAKGLFIEW